jgi:hypothetical protein
MMGKLGERGISNMTIAVVDGIGGGIGAQIVERLRREGIRDARILALGANAVATQRMVDAGADKGASGENAIRVSVACADFILGPIGIVLPNAMMGEITTAIAEAVFGARGKKLLLPLSQPHVLIVGMAQKNVNDLISDAIAALKRLISEPD